jgi:dTDP-glucose 4,6-dehydratase
MPSKPLPEADLAEVTQHAREAFLHMWRANLFLTGGTGFFGKWLLESLLYANRELRLHLQATLLTRNAEAFRRSAPHIANDPDVTLLEGDVRSFAFPRGAFTHIVHGAADSTGRQTTQPENELAETIVEGTRRVLEFADGTGAGRLLFLSTGAVYGRSTPLLQTPESYLDTHPAPLLPNSYDEAKRQAETLCLEAASPEFEVTVARCFAFVGPHLPLDTHFAIGNFLGAAIRDEAIQIHGDGTPRRSWLYMSDLAAWLWTLAAAGKSGRAYNVGSDETYTIAEAARLTAATLRPDGHGDSSLPIRIEGQPIPGAPANNYVPDITRARQDLDLHVTVPLAEALRRTARWHAYDVPQRAATQ